MTEEPLQAATPASAGTTPGVGGPGGQKSGQQTDGGPIRAPAPMWRCSKIMHLQRELHPTILNSLEGIVDQVCNKGWKKGLHTLSIINSRFLLAIKWQLHYIQVHNTKLAGQYWWPSMHKEKAPHLFLITRFYFQLKIKFFQTCNAELTRGYSVVNRV